MIPDLAADETVEERQGYGPVRLEVQSTAYIGCLHNSNNTAELSAVPHAMIDYIQWRRRSNAGETLSGTRTNAHLFSFN